MTDPTLRTFEIQPSTWWGKLLAAAILLLLVGLAVVFFTVFVVLLAVAVIVAPLVGWWRARRLRGTRPVPSARGPVIDVEYEIRDKP